MPSHQRDSRRIAKKVPHVPADNLRWRVKAMKKAANSDVCHHRPTPAAVAILALRFGHVDMCPW
jgi:hypothetical protein